MKCRKISGFIFCCQLWFLPPVSPALDLFTPNHRVEPQKSASYESATAGNIWKRSRHLPLMESKLIAAIRKVEKAEQLLLLLDSCQSILGSSSLFSDKSLLTVISNQAPSWSTNFPRFDKHCSFWQFKYTWALFYLWMDITLQKLLSEPSVFLKQCFKIRRSLDITWGFSS